MDSVSKDSEELNENLSKGNQQSSIEPIGKDVIHRICSGQVRISLFILRSYRQVTLYFR